MKIEVYGAAWCGPCKMVKGLFNREGIEYEYVDIDQEPNQAAAANVRGIPCTIVYGDNEVELNRFVGTSHNLVEKIRGLGNE